MPMLEVENIHSYYGTIHALKGISLYVDEAEIVCSIGGNGAGKSTTLKTISRILQPRHGTVRLNGEDLSKYKPNEVVAKGIVQASRRARIAWCATPLSPPSSSNASSNR